MSSRFPYLVTFKPDENNIAVSMPRILEEKSPYKRLALKDILLADLVQETEYELTFRKNLNPESIQHEISVFFTNFFNTLEKIDSENRRFRLTLSQGWRSEFQIFSQEEIENLEIKENSYKTFKEKTNQKINSILQNLSAEDDKKKTFPIS